MLTEMGYGSNKRGVHIIVKNIYQLSCMIKRKGLIYEEGNLNQQNLKGDALSHP